eukprot:3394880-Prymnesium_polylepis.1
MSMNCSTIQRSLAAIPGTSTMTRKNAGSELRPPLRPRNAMTAAARTGRGLGANLETAVITAQRHKADHVLCRVTRALTVLNPDSHHIPTHGPCCAHRTIRGRSALSGSSSSADSSSAAPSCAEGSGGASWMLRGGRCSRSQPDMSSAASLAGLLFAQPHAPAAAPLPPG